MSLSSDLSIEDSPTNITKGKKHRRNPPIWAKTVPKALRCAADIPRLRVVSSSEVQHNVRAEVQRKLANLGLVFEDGV